jgi:hypothetical protein
MEDQNDRPPLVRRVPGATRARPADPERRELPELPEEVRQRIQAVVSAAHAQAAQELEAQREEEARRGQPQPAQPVRRKRSAKIPHRGPAASGATSPKGTSRSEAPTPQPRQGHWSDVDAEFDTSPLPRLTASGAIASPEANDISPQPSRTAAPNGAANPDLANTQRQAARQEQERGALRKRTARQERVAQREHAAEQERAARQEQESARQEEERAAQERAEQEHARQERERAAQQERERAAAQERARQEEERAAQRQARQAEERAAQQRAQLEQERAAQQRAQLEQERARLEQERAAQQRAEQEQARQERERAAQQERERAAQQERERAAAQERARQAQESLARQERKRAAKQERAARRERAAEQKRAAKQERERAAQELIKQEGAARERAREEQERAKEELARKLEELAAQERIRQEQEREDREWAAQKRARLEREREEAEELARREQGAAEHNGAAQPAPRQFAAAGPARAQLPAQPQLRAPEVAGSRRYRTSALITAMVILLGAGSLAVARSLRTSAHAPTRTPEIATVIRNEAAAWVAQQVSHSVLISCDRVMCQALLEHGVSRNHLFVLQSQAAKPFNSQVKIVVATADIRDLFGSHLASVYAPARLASFGSGNARIDIRQIVPNGAAGYEAALKKDLHFRQAVENTLSNSLQFVTSASVRKQLAAGLVDEDLFVLLEGLAGYESLPVDIVAFGDLGPGASAGIPFRSATLAGSMATLQSMLTWIRTEAPKQYIPAHAEITQQHGQPVLIVEFAAPSKLGMFNPPNQ